MINLLEILEKEFNLKSFRPGQREIIDSILLGEQVVAILPTGGGKSLCYQLPALISEKPSIVISPMISLMKDQVDKINLLKKNAAFINSSISQFEADKVLREIFDGKIKILYLSPEKITSPQFQRRLSEINWEYLFVDEAHCISEWGHNFRPSYRKIYEFTSNLQIRKVSAFTATATPEVRKDIVTQLHLDNPKIFVRGFERPNLSLHVIKTNRKKEELFKIFSSGERPGIVYCATRKETEETAEFLRLQGFSVNHYHAGLSSELRKLIQDDFISGKIEIITATNAFGMGIDKEDIRTVVHYNIPASIENYYQEIGRAGRDGKRAEIFLLYSKRDKAIHEYIISNSYPTFDEVKTIYNGIADYSRTALGSLYKGDIPLDRSFYNFFQIKDISKSKLENAISILSDSGYLKTSSPTVTNYSFRFLLSPPEIKTYITKIAKSEYAELLTVISKLYLTAPFKGETNINLNRVANSISSSFSKVRELLRELDVIGILTFNEPQEFKTIKLNTTRVRSEDLLIDFGKIEKLIENQLGKLSRMIDYAENGSCRMNFILDYFGENRNYKCGICDNCIPSNKGKDDSLNNFLSEIILRTIEKLDFPVPTDLLINALTGKSRSIKAMELPNYGVCKNYNKDELKLAIEFLESNNKIKIKGKEISRVEKEFSKDRKSAEQSFDYEKEVEAFKKLEKVRKDTAIKFNQSIMMICSDEFLRELVRKKPKDKFDFLSIKGANPRLWNKFGEEAIFALKNFRSTKSSAKKPFDEERKIPENLLRIKNFLSKGKSLYEIAEATNLPESVVSMQIESLLSYAPETDISSVIPSEKFQAVSTLVEEGIVNLKDLKSQLPEDFTYAEIRIVLAKAEPSLNF